MVAPPPLVPSASDHTATVLPDGRVLLVGGTACYHRGCQGGGQAIQSAELYDPPSRRWTATAPPLRAHQYHTATLLPDGRVLVAGGDTLDPGGVSDEITDTGEIWSSHTGLWSLTGPMRHPRLGHTATLLSNGKVFVAGGVVPPVGSGAWTASTELFDPATGRWSDGPPLASPRADHTATLLKDGSVLLAGGRDGLGGHGQGGDHPSLSSAERYNPLTGTMTLVAHLLHSHRTNHTATLLDDGTVLIAGGATRYYHGGAGDATKSVEIYHPDSDTFTDGPPLLGARLAHAALRLRDGRVLVVGGLPAGDSIRGTEHHSAAPELYDTAVPRWVPAAPPPADPTSRLLKGFVGEVRLAGNLSLSPLSNGAVLVIGGDDPGRSAQLFDPTVDAPAGAGSDTAPTLVIATAAAVLLIGVAIVTLVIVRRRRSPRSVRPGNTRGIGVG